ncbi:MAG TPA: hypothetical protein VJA26_08470 [Gammaproteobacteria bacterium]|nr:hypothetical protein [Gammaproteobacteria bacterium]
MIRRLELVGILAVLALQGATGHAQPPSTVAAKLSEGVWAYVGKDGEVVVSGSFLGVPPDSALRPEAVAAREAFDFRTGDPVLGCGAPGMPRALTAGSPMTFAWIGDDLTINYESMDVERVVHMNGERPGANIPRTPNGFSVGRWEGDALVVTTTRLDDRVVDMLGTPKSDGMAVEERYRIDATGGDTYLRVELIMNDPQTFVAPYVWHFDFVLRRDWELMEYACVERPVELTPGVVAN